LIEDFIGPLAQKKLSKTATQLFEFARDKIEQLAVDEGNLAGVNTIAFT
jgi:hypothetical protein